MASAGSVFVDLLLRDSQYASGWQKARNTTRQNTSQIRGDVNQLGKAFDGVLDPVNNISNSIKSLGAVIAGALSVQKVIQYSDTWKQLSGRLLIVEGSLENLTKTQQDLFEIAQRNRQPLESVLSFYSRLKQFIPETERAQYDLLGVTESVTAALAITGETSQAASGALIQFTQAIGTNFEAAGQELRSLQEQAPRLTQAIMNALGDGTQSLQQLVKAGLLTRESLLNALGGLGEEGKRLADELAKVPITVAQAFTHLDNAFLKFIGQSKAVASGTSSLVVGIQALAANLDLVANAIVLTSSVLVARLIPGLVANAAAFVSAQRQAILYQATLARMAGVSVAAAAGVSALGGALALLGGPIGALIVASVAIYTFSDEILQFADRFKVFGTSVGQILRDIGSGAVDIFKGIGSVLSDIGNFTVNTFSGVVSAIDGLFNSALIRIAKFIQEVNKIPGFNISDDTVLGLLARPGAYESGLRSISDNFSRGVERANLPDFKSPETPSLDGGNRTSTGGSSSGSSKSTREKVDSIDKFLTKQRELLKTLQQEAEYIGLTSIEITKLKDAREFDTKVAERSLGLKGQELIKFREQTDAIRQLRQEAIETNYELSRSAETGITEFFKKYQEDATNAAKNVQSVLETAFKGAEDAFVEFAKTGKFSFKDFANSILEDIIRIQFRAQAAKLSGALSEIAGSIFGSIGGSAFGGATSSVNYSVQGGLNLKNLPMYADGGYIGPGQYGIAGEAGAELIYGGKTGATVIPQTGGNVVNIINNTPSQVSTRSGTNGASIDVVIDQAVASALSRPGSLTNQALQNQQSRGLTRR